MGKVRIQSVDLLGQGWVQTVELGLDRLSFRRDFDFEGSFAVVKSVLRENICIS